MEGRCRIKRNRGGVPGRCQLSTNVQPSLWQHIPLAKAFLCQDCDEVGDSEQACPACASQSLLPLAVVLNRQPGKPEGK